jgi:hypothetical protein
MTRKQIRERILTALNDSATAPVFFREADVHQSITDGQEVLSEEAPLIKVTYTLPRRAGALLYSLPGVGDRIQAPYRLWLPDLQRRLEPVELTDLDARHETWMTVPGDPYVWAPVDWRTFLIWPVPAAGGGWLQVDCYAWPEPMTDDADEPRDLALSDHEALVFYGEMMGHLLQWNPAQAADLWAGFVQHWGSAATSADLKRLVSRSWTRPDRPDAARDDRA